MTITCWSEIPLPERSVVAFDLDDTLYTERDFVRSGFRAAAAIFPQRQQESVFTSLMRLFESGHADPYAAVLGELDTPELDVTQTRMIAAYRTHCPRLTLSSRAVDLLCELRIAGHPLAIITDGRNTTQHNKIRALGLDRWIDVVLISEDLGVEKPDERAYRHVAQCFPGRSYAYVGNDTKKDFIAPNRLGWTTIGVTNDGSQLRKQTTGNLAPECLPQFWIDPLA